MKRSRIPYVVLLALLGAAALRSQPAAEPSAKQDEAIRKTQKLLTENFISIKEKTETPLAKLLESLEKQLPEGQKVSLRIDKDAFGKDFAEVAAASIRLPKLQGVSLFTVLKLARGQIALKTDYRFGDREFVLTTPARALYTAVHDIGDVVVKPETLEGLSPSTRRMVASKNVRRDPTQTAAGVVQLIVSVVDSESWQQQSVPHGTIQVANGTKLIVHANADRHEQITDLLQALRRLNDVEVSIKAQLFEVDQAFYTKLRAVKRVSHGELEKQVEQGIMPEGDALWQLLKKQKLVLSGAEAKIANGLEGVFLSRHKAVVCPPLLSGRNLPAGLDGLASLTEPQTVLEGVSFRTGVTVSADRRFVHFKITEKSAEIEQLPKIDAGLPALKKLKGENGKQDVQEQVVELLQALRNQGPLEPVLSESVHTGETEIPDGGSRMIPVQVRPRPLQAENRWWVLVVRPRIIIQEEEREILDNGLELTLPALLADLLTNPRLKATRAFYGSPDDNRFALVASAAWAWPKEFKPAVPDHQLTPSARKGKRLLGIRIDEFKWAGDSDLSLRVTLVNAGGTENGAAPGGCTLRYTARMKDKKRVVELAEPQP